MISSLRKVFDLSKSRVLTIPKNHILANNNVVKEIYSQNIIVIMKPEYSKNDLLKEMETFINELRKTEII